MSFNNREEEVLADYYERHGRTPNADPSAWCVVGALRASGAIFIAAPIRILSHLGTQPALSCWLPWLLRLVPLGLASSW